MVVTTQRYCRHALYEHVSVGGASSSSGASVPAAIASGVGDAPPVTVNRWELFTGPSATGYVYDENNRQIGRFQRGRPANSCYVRSKYKHVSIRTAPQLIP